MSGFSRREFLAAMMAGGAVIAGELWIPGQKLISIPSRKIFIPDGRLAWVEDGVTYMYGGGRKTEIPTYFDIAVRGAEITGKSLLALRKNSGEIWR